MISPRPFGFTHCCLLALLLAPCAKAEDSALPVATVVHHPAILLEADVPGRDKGWEELERSGAEQARKEWAIRLDEYTLEPGGDREKKLQWIADSGAGLILLMGPENAAPLERLAPRYPGTHFVLIGARIASNLPNVASLVFKEEEGAFLAGMLAALTSANDAVGFIGGLNSPAMRALARGYAQGAHYAKPSVRILDAMVRQGQEAQNDSDRAVAIAEAQFAQGVDVIFVAADEAAMRKVLQDAYQLNKRVIGFGMNCNALYPGTVLSSIVRRVDLAVLSALKSASDGIWTPGVYYLSAADGYLDYLVDSNNRRLISKDTIDRMEAAKDRMERGALKVKVADPD